MRQAVHQAARTNRIHCFECRPQRLAWPSDAQPADGVAGELTRYSREALDRAGSCSPGKRQPLALAQLVDSGKFGASGPGGVIKAHRESMDLALGAADTGETADVIDLMFRED